MRVLLGVGLIFSLVGGVLLTGAGVMFYSDRNFAAHALRADGEVVDLSRERSRDSDGRSSTTYTAHVGFIDRNGEPREFAERVSTNPPRFSRGDRVAVLYAPDRPENAIVDDFQGRHMGTLIFGGISLPMTVLGFVLVAIDIRGRRKRARLREHGQPIEAEFLHVYRDTSVKVNGDHPYRVVAQGRDPRTGKLRRYESEPIWVDPTDQLQGRTVCVLIDPGGKAHLIDLEGIVEPDAREN